MRTIMHTIKYYNRTLQAACHRYYSCKVFEDEDAKFTVCRAERCRRSNLRAIRVLRKTALRCLNREEESRDRVFANLSIFLEMIEAP